MYIKKFKLDPFSKTMAQIMDISAKVVNEKVIDENKILNLMNSAVSHDMRNPINSIDCQIF